MVIVKQKLTKTNSILKKMTTYQPEVGGEYTTGYLKTLIKTKELHKDLEKMEFLSTVLTNPDLKFYATSDTVQKVDRNHKVVPTIRKFK